MAMKGLVLPLFIFKAGPMGLLRSVGHSIQAALIFL